MSTFTIGDDLRGILEDVVKSDKQRLFAGNYFKNLHTEFNHKPEQIGVATAGLSSAERELVKLHRRELSLCLLNGFYAHFTAGPVGQNPMAPTGPAQSLETRSQEAKFARDFAPTAAIKPGTMPWLHRLLEDEPIRNYEDFLSLAAAARRLHDSPYGSLYQGCSFYSFGRLKAARACLSSISNNSPLAPRILASRTLQSTHHRIGSIEAGLSVSFELMRLFEAMGHEDELLAELERLAVSRLLDPSLLRIQLPNAVMSYAFSLRRRLSMDSETFKVSAPQSLLSKIALQTNPVDLFGVLTETKR